MSFWKRSQNRTRQALLEDYHRHHVTSIDDPEDREWIREVLKPRPAEVVLGTKVVFVDARHFDPHLNRGQQDMSWLYQFVLPIPEGNTAAIIQKGLGLPDYNSALAVMELWLTARFLELDKDGIVLNPDKAQPLNLPSTKVVGSLGGVCSRELLRLYCTHVDPHLEEEGEYVFDRDAFDEAVQNFAACHQDVVISLKELADHFKVPVALIKTLNQRMGSPFYVTGDFIVFPEPSGVKKGQQLSRIRAILEEENRKARAAQQELEARERRVKADHMEEEKARAELLESKAKLQRELLACYLIQGRQEAVQ